jgi:Fe-S-cluster-containing dehydrogenase component
MPGTGEDSETMAQRSRREVAVRCDMCQGWREKNGKKITACMEACPARALSMVEPDGTVVLPPPPETRPDEASGAPKRASDEKAGAAAAATAKAKNVPEAQPSEPERTETTPIKASPAETRPSETAMKKPAAKAVATDKAKAKLKKAASQK